MVWGFSEALDLYDVYEKALQKQNESEEKNLKEVSLENDQSKSSFNVLILGAGDPRHILKTLAKSYTHQNLYMNFYVIEESMEINARNFILLATALENTSNMSLRQKSQLFMDVFGNTIVRSSTYMYIAELAKWIKDVIRLEKATATWPTINLEYLKHYERSRLEDIFDFFAQEQLDTFDLRGNWKNNVENMLEVRYDHRAGAFDWDLQMKLKTRGGNAICSEEYRNWRETGIAFTFPEWEQSRTNKTFCAQFRRVGNNFIHRGFIWDMKNGPFMTYCPMSDEDTKKPANNVRERRATDIIQHILVELIHELHNQCKYSLIQHDADDEQKKLNHALEIARILRSKKSNETNCRVINIKDTKIHILSETDFIKMQKSNCQWQNSFDVIFVGRNIFPCINPLLLQTLRQNGLLILETQQFSVSRDIEKFSQKLKTFAKTCDLKSVHAYNELNKQYPILKFFKDKKT